MKIGFLGNMNNYPFQLARGFKKLGHKIIFLVNDTVPLHRPENRFHDVSFPYPGWIIDVGRLSETDCVVPNDRRDKIVDYLSKCDFVVLNQLGPSLAHLIKRPSVLLLTGSDLEYYASWKTLSGLFPGWDYIGNPLDSPSYEINKMVWYSLIRQQREGIQNALLIHFLARGLSKIGDSILDELGINDDRRMMLLSSSLADEKRIEMLPTNKWVRVFCGARLSWKLPLPFGFTQLDYKGSDIMISGFGLFYRKTKYPLDIILVRKGLHIEETEQLICDEDISSLITWNEELSQKAVIDEFRRADIVFDQVGQSLPGLITSDAMALGRPVIANARQNAFKSTFGELPPICQASTPEEVCSQLERLVFNPKERNKVGVESRKYAEKYFSPLLAAKKILSKISIK